MTHAHHRGEANRSADQAEAALTEAQVFAELAKLLGKVELVPDSQMPTSQTPTSQTLTSQTNEVAPAQPPISAPAIAPEPPVTAELEAIAQLQTLLFSIDDARLKQLMERLENPQQRAIDVAEVLHHAVQHQVEARRDQFVAAMVPTIEQAIETSIRQDEQVMAEAIFPIVGSAARKAIAAALENAMQALDHTLEQTLSPRALQWKLEAWRTGRPFAEVVLLRTLLFRVEQVFLIHRHTALLLQHCAAPTVAAQNPDLVSAMLIAIQDFVRDSFTVRSGEMLEALRLAISPFGLNRDHRRFWQASFADRLRSNCASRFGKRSSRFIANLELRSPLFKAMPLLLRPLSLIWKIAFSRATKYHPHPREILMLGECCPFCCWDLAHGATATFKFASAGQLMCSR